MNPPVSADSMYAPSTSTQVASAPVSPPESSSRQYRVSNPTKEAWVLDSLGKRRSEFLKNQQITAFVGTWNVNGRGPPGVKELGDYLNLAPAASGGQVVFDKLPELLVLGFQELDVRAEAFVYNNAAKDIQWTEALEQAMGEARYSYGKVASRQLIGMFLMVYARIDCMASVSHVEAASVGCGIMGVVGNKGAVAVRLEYLDTPLCFVCAHLAHDAAQIEKRNAQFHDLCKRLWFEGSAENRASRAEPLVPFGAAGVQRTGGGVGIFDHSYVIWLGDLNYRLALDTGDVYDVVRRGDYQALLGLDQLKIAMLNKQAFAGFDEADIRFAPTYKYVVGTDEYDERRRPAWCDRILWWTRPGCEEGVCSLSYEAVQQLLTSDHKPVRSVIALDVWRVDSEARHAVYRDVLRELDRFENECIPVAALESTSVDFGPVWFGREARRSMRLQNVGQVPLEFSFVATPSRSSYAPPWLHITPDCGMLLPGQSCNLSFTALVDRECSAALNTREEGLSDILVLHLTRGRDYFVQVQGDYQVSVYGMSLDVLVHCKQPVRQMRPADFARCLESGQFSVPRCVWEMTDFLSRYAVDRGYSLFYWPGDRELARRVREWLDCDEKIPPEQVLQWQGDAEGFVAGTAVEGSTSRVAGRILGVATAAAAAAAAASTAAVGQGTLVSRDPSTLELITASAAEQNQQHLQQQQPVNTAESMLERLNLGPTTSNEPSDWAASDSEPEGSGPSTLSSTQTATGTAPASGHIIPSATDTGPGGGAPTSVSAAPVINAEPIAGTELSAPHDTGVDTMRWSVVELLRHTVWGKFLVEY
ncbi:hypothetical protein GGI07_000236 [Coemansia sp. Benny D115]|nr:hypothetical protein GGI07_000236 [Coemansia sp. Benny D115]